MSHRYAPLANPVHRRQPSQHDREVEMQAAFDYSDDEDDANETRPLNPTQPHSLPNHSHSPRAYDFEAVDYDYPPPGSPPPPSATALPNNFGNSNGLIPPFSPPPIPQSRPIWFHRAAAAVLPHSLLNTVGLALPRHTGPIGGGTNNDGVFANVTAKPTAPHRVQEGDDTILVPEDTRPEAPPSYASAQADAVPPYWETTIHAPFASDSIGDMVIDNLPTGSLFSFCWNLLVSISFQFIGFLLTYLLHTSHAARFGSRAGLGVTLIQYGFALRSHINNSDPSDGNTGDWEWPSSDNTGSEPHHHHHIDMTNITWSTPVSNMTEAQASILVADATTEWLSFFLMTVGWFVLLTSILGFWRVKRWERGVLASRGDHNNPQPVRPNAFFGQIDNTFALNSSSRFDLLRAGFGFNPRNPEVAPAPSAALSDHNADRETDPMLPHSAHTDPARAQESATALASEQRLQRDLRDAGLL